MKKIFNIGLLAIILLPSITFGQKTEVDSVVLSDFQIQINDASADLFENYLDGNQEAVKEGSLNLTWSSISINSNVKVRFKYSNDLEWNYSDEFPSSNTSITIDSLDENKILDWSIGNGSSWSNTIHSPTMGDHVIENMVVKEIEEGVKISWSINYDVSKYLSDNNIKAIISYNTDIGKKRHKSGMEGNDWIVSEPFSILKNKYTIEGLIGNEKYHFKLGFAPISNVDIAKAAKSQMLYSKTIKAKTKRGWGLAKILILIGSLGFFIYGMKLMSEGLQQASGSMLRKMLGSITSNRFKGVLTGFGITSLVQSSSVTTVMTVSFVNAGLMNLRQSAGVMMGANIGTTITAWIILIIGFKVSVGSYAYMMIALAFPLLFIKTGKAKSWATAIVGFCILFIGLGELKDAVPSLDNDSGIVQFFIDFKDAWYGPLMFVILGALVTVVIQSSSAAMALTLALVAKGAIPYEVACAMVLGENIGTTITAELASLIANVHAKRSARIHSMFNLVGVTWMLLIFSFFTDLVGEVVGYSTGEEFNPLDNAMAATGIAFFHTFFNLANVVLLIWFVPQLVTLAERTVKSKGDSDEEFKLDFIGGPIGSTAEMCILEAQKEVSKFGAVTARMNGFVHDAINNSNLKKKAKLFSKLEKYEEITDRVEVEIGDYLTKVSSLEMSERASTKMRGMLSITNDLERIGDIFYQISKALEKKEEGKIYFTPEQREGLNEMSAVIDEAFVTMNANLEADKKDVDIKEAMDIEIKINKLRNKLRKTHLKNLESGEANMKGSLVYSNVFSSLERVGDHIINVSEAIAGEV
jgi:phosphate:Na+ symporter